jgi:hypothetical protein
MADKNKILTILTTWASQHNGTVSEGQTQYEENLSYWTIKIKEASENGDITIMVRPNEYGPLEVAPANDYAWFERYGCDTDSLFQILDLSLTDIYSDKWKTDPGQGML